MEEFVHLLPGAEQGSKPYQLAIAHCVIAGRNPAILLMQTYFRAAKHDSSFRDSLFYNQSPISEKSRSFCSAKTATQNLKLVYKAHLLSVYTAQKARPCTYA
ncbi:MAG: hypothetical protein PUF61_06430 [Spirochaetales bacterium]|nr:hypothetical protein [Spirochaetales bacterium]